MGTTSRPPKWIKPQLTRLVNEAPTGKDWLHEIKYDGYRMHARLDGGKVQQLTRTGLDWSHRYPSTIEALRAQSLERWRSSPLSQSKHPRLARRAALWLRRIANGR